MKAFCVACFMRSGAIPLAPENCHVGDPLAVQRTVPSACAVCVVAAEGSNGAKTSAPGGVLKVHTCAAAFAVRTRRATSSDSLTAHCDANAAASLTANPHAFEQAPTADATSRSRPRYPGNAADMCAHHPWVQEEGRYTRPPSEPETTTCSRRDCHAHRSSIDASQGVLKRSLENRPGNRQRLVLARTQTR